MEGLGPAGIWGKTVIEYQIWTLLLYTLEYKGYGPCTKFSSVFYE